MQRTLWYLIFILCVALVLLCTRSQSSDTVISLPAQLASVVQVVGLDSSCSGFIARRGIVVTAGHCIDLEEKFAFVRFPDGESKPYKVISRVLKLDCANDWAVLMTDTGNRRPLPIGPVPEVGDQVFRIGYPNHATKQVLKAGKVVSVTNDAIVSVPMALPGESGGPVFDAVGRVVGLVDCYDWKFETAVGGRARLFRDLLGGL